MRKSFKALSFIVSSRLTGVLPLALFVLLLLLFDVLTDDVEADTFDRDWNKLAPIVIDAHVLAPRANTRARDMLLFWLWRPGLPGRLKGRNIYTPIIQAKLYKKLAVLTERWIVDGGGLNKRRGGGRGGRGRGGRGGGGTRALNKRGRNGVFELF